MLNQEQCEAIVGPHKAALRACVLEGLAFYANEYPPHVRSQHTLRTAASARHDHIIASVRRTFDGVPGAYVATRGNLVMLVVSGTVAGGSISTVAMRFHKLDDGEPSSNDTQQTFSFSNQLPMPTQEELRDIPFHPTYLTVGYELDALAMVKAVTWSCRNRGTVIWGEPLPDAGSAIEQLADRRAVEQSERKGKVTGRAPSRQANLGADDDVDG